MRLYNLTKSMVRYHNKKSQPISSCAYCETRDLPTKIYSVHSPVNQRKYHSSEGGLPGKKSVGMLTYQQSTLKSHHTTYLASAAGTFLKTT